MFGKFFLSNCLSICAMLFLTYITITYLLRKKFNEINHRIYRMIIVASYALIISHMSIYFFLDNPDIISRIFSIVCIIFCSLVGLYFITTFDIKHDENEKKNLKKLLIIYNSIVLVFCIASLFVECKVINEETYSVSNKLLYVAAGYDALILFRVLFKHKDRTTKLQKISIVYILLAFIIITAFKILTNSAFGYLVYFCILLTIIIYFSFESQAYILSHDLEASRKMLIETNTKKNDFLYSISNNLRVPISNIITATEQIKNENLSNEEYLQKVNYLKCEIINLSNFINKVDSMTIDFGNTDITNVENKKEVNELNNNNINSQDGKVVDIK